MKTSNFFGVPANCKDFDFRTDLFGWCKKDVIAYLEESDETAAGLATVLNEEIDLLKSENTKLKLAIARNYAAESECVATHQKRVPKIDKLANIRRETTELRKFATDAIYAFEQELAAL